MLFANGCYLEWRKTSDSCESIEDNISQSIEDNKKSTEDYKKSIEDYMKSIEDQCQLLFEAMSKYIAINFFNTQ